MLLPLYPNLERFTLNMTRNRDWAKDVTSETVLKAYDSFDSLRGEQAFLSFLFTIASRVYYAQINRAGKRIYEEQDLDELYSIAPGPDELADAKALHEALDKLPEKMKEAIVLFELEGFSYKEIAEIQTTTVDNIKVRLHRGKAKLEELLQDGEMARTKSAPKKAKSINKNNSIAHVL